VFYLKETKLVLRLYTHLFPSIFFLDFIETETYRYCFSYEDVMIISQLIQINMIRFEFSNFNVTYAHESILLALQTMLNLQHPSLM